MDHKEYTAQWQTFLRGNWSKETPQKSGKFPIMDIDGNQGGFIVVYKSPANGEFTRAERWGAWIWSEPLPELHPMPEGLSVEVTST